MGSRRSSPRSALEEGAGAALAPCYDAVSHLVYAAGGALRAVSFDLATLETRGTPVQVIPDVVTTGIGGMDAVVAGDGTLVYVSGHSVTGAGAPRTLVWVDRQGRETPIPAPSRPFLYPRLSPDGTRVALFAVDQEYDLWLWDLTRSTLTRATFEPGGDVFPVWTRDGGKALRVARALESGNLSNNSNSAVRVTTPFGGFKQSGIGRELGPNALDYYTEVKNVYIATEED